MLLFVGRTGRLVTGKFPTGVLSARAMGTIVPGVDFDTVAREWRFKWSLENDKTSLAKAQEVLKKFTPKIKSVDGVKGVQRIVCGGCQDFKVIVCLSAEKFGAWGEKKFSPEEDFLAEINKIPGVSTVETQTYTIMPVV